MSRPTRAVILPPPLSRRDEAFHAELAHAAGADLDGRAVWRALSAWPWLVGGRIQDAAARIWIVPSVRTEGRRYHVHLDGGDCYYFDLAGGKHDCPDRAFNGHRNGGRCCHYQAALRKEYQMFGDRADRVFKATEAA